jgi:hypothetical protein
MSKQREPLIVEGGGIRVEIDYSRRGSDAGLRFRVYYGETSNTASELLRFDCFQKRPHFHYLGQGKRKLERIDKKIAPDPVRWTLARIKGDLPSLIWKAGYRKLSKQIDQRALAKALSRAEKGILRLAP